MVKKHIPSCPVSREHRGEKAAHTIQPNDETNEKLLEPFGFENRGGWWFGELTREEYDELKPKLKCHSFTIDCICFSPYLSTKGNIELNRVRTRKELAQGWGPGYKVPDPESEENKEPSEPGWGQWILSLIGLGPKEEEPEPDPTLDPDWQPEWT